MTVEPKQTAQGLERGKLEAVCASADAAVPLKTPTPAQQHIKKGLHSVSYTTACTTSERDKTTG